MLEEVMKIPKKVMLAATTAMLTNIAAFSEVFRRNAGQRRLSEAMEVGDLSRWPGQCHVKTST
jgi:hypothetical protein